MENVEVNLGQQGAKRQTWSGNSPRALLLRLIEENPGANVEEIAKLMLERADDDVLLPIIVYWTKHNWRALDDRTPSLSTKIKAAKSEVAARVSEVREKLKERIAVVFLEQVMPNGKRLAECSGAECRRFGGFYAAIGEKIKPRDRVGKVLSEQDLAALWRKHYR